MKMINKSFSYHDSILNCGWETYRQRNVPVAKRTVTETYRYRNVPVPKHIGSETYQYLNIPVAKRTSIITPF